MKHDALMISLPRFSYLEVKPVGLLEVKLIEAKELTNKDLIGKSDPFAKLCIRPLPDKTKNSKTIVRKKPFMAFIEQVITT